MIRDIRDLQVRSKYRFLASADGGPDHNSSMLATPDGVIDEVPGMRFPGMRERRGSWGGAALPVSPVASKLRIS
ncbi:hypothetical protein D7Y54_10795 [Stenotrophomonas maltophilia]|nr:hypothetical protein [Stenotrophomonas maltophilia]